MKKLMLVCAPVSSRSGYGDHARDLVTSFLNLDQYNIKILDVPWGGCPRNALKHDNPNDKRILDCILNEPQMERQPDIYVDIRIPNEFQQLGKFNIGITAGIETNAVSPQWLEGCNKMDLTIVPSNHSKNGFITSHYDKMQDLPDGKKQKIGELKLEKPIEVLFEGVDLNKFKNIRIDDIPDNFYKNINDTITEKFAFLSVGQWVKGDYGEDRKDLGRTIKIFYETFANKKKQPALIMKTSGAGFSIMDKEETLNKINSIKSMFPASAKLPNVYLLHGDLSTEEMNYLYNHPKIKAMVSFTHGEGFGRPLLEATMTGLPIIASNWSGHVDFLDPEKTLLVSGKLEQVPKSAVWENIIIPESKWFNVDEGVAGNMLNLLFNNVYDAKILAKELMKINKEKYTLRDMEDQLGDIMKQYTSHLASQVNLKLPELKKFKKPNKTKIKLPKLSKVGA